MNDAEMINQSHYRRAYNYLRSSVGKQGSYSSTGSNAAKILNDKDVSAVERTSVEPLELVFFPSYARCLRDGTIRLDIRVHGWLYNPVPAGKQSRRNRYTMLLARSIAGLPSLPSQEELSRPNTSESTNSETAMESEHHETYAASEASSPTTPGVDSPTFSSFIAPKGDDSVPPSPKRHDSEFSIGSESSVSSHRLSRYFTDSDIVSCHANLVSRMAPFLAKPVVGRPVKIQLFADNKLIMSENMYTGDNGHFRGTIEVEAKELDIASLHTLEARIDHSEGLVGHTSIRLLPDAGVSVISDMDDTVKHTDIPAGMREAFRNAFVRDLNTLEVPGVRKWYSSMTQMGCPIHYVSNAPFQLWPCLASFIKTVGLPHGTIHLKQYSGMIQGLFEPAAEKKRANVTRILLDFPSRKFLLIGDSGEQDLELYTELAQTTFANQILGIFIRDVSSGAAPTDDSAGASGEGFFSAGSGDNVVDNVVRTESGPPALPPRPEPDLLGLHTKSDAVGVKDDQGSHMYDMLALETAISSTDSLPVAVPEPNTKTSKPALPNRPLLRRLLTKPEGTPDSEKTERPSQPISPVAHANTAPVSPTKRPGIFRTVSANSATYAENRKLTEAQKMSRRVARARASLPKEIKLYIWKNGGDAQQYAEELIKKALEGRTA